MVQVKNIRPETGDELLKERLPISCKRGMSFFGDLVENSIRYARLVFVTGMERNVPVSGDGIPTLIVPPPGVGVIGYRHGKILVEDTGVVLRISIAERTGDKVDTMTLIDKCP
jgi:hypothetical protein